MTASPPPDVVSVVGARPQFVKAAPVSRALAAAGVREVLVHTGQHYDWEMSRAFFDGLELPEPTLDLGVGSAPHGAQTGRMLEGVERALLHLRPRLVLVYGDTNSTLAGALAAAKLHLAVAHVEAGLRSFNRRMPEEVNRVVADSLATLLFAPTDAAVANLAAEGIRAGVVRTGDVMLDQAMASRSVVIGRTAEVLGRFGVKAGCYALATIHRAENTDAPERWQGIVEGVARIGRGGLDVVWLVHPRTDALVRGLALPGVRTWPAQPYVETQVLVRSARVVITDSGGLQKEAAFHRRPCVTLRDETEWVELVEAGVNRLVGADPDALFEAAATARWPPGGLPENVYGDGNTAAVIAAEVATLLSTQE